MQCWVVSSLIWDAAPSPYVQLSLLVQENAELKRREAALQSAVSSLAGSVSAATKAVLVSSSVDAADALHATFRPASPDVRFSISDYKGFLLRMQQREAAVQVGGNVVCLPVISPPISTERVHSGACRHTVYIRGCPGCCLVCCCCCLAVQRTMSQLMQPSRAHMCQQPVCRRVLF